MKIKNQQIMSDGITIIVLGSKNAGDPWYCRVDNPSAEADKQPEELYYFNAIITEDTKQVLAGYGLIKATTAWFETLKAFMDDAEGKPFLFHARRHGKRGATTPSTSGELSEKNLWQISQWKRHSQSIADVEVELKSRADAERKEMSEAQPGNSSAVKPLEQAKPKQPTKTAPAKGWGAVSKSQRDREIEAQILADIESGKIADCLE